AGLARQANDPQLLMTQGRLQVLGGDRAGAGKSGNAALQHVGGELSVSHLVLLHLGLAEYQSDRGDVASLHATRDKLQSLVPDAPVTALVDMRIHVLRGEG